MDDRYTDAARYIAGSHCCHSLWQKAYTGYTFPPYFLLHPISNSIHEVIHLYKVYRKALVNRMTAYAGFHYKACRGINQKHNCICILPFHIQAIPYRQPFAYRIKCYRKREHGNSFIDASTNTKKPRITRYRHPPVSVTQGKADAAIKNACKHMLS